MRVAIERLMGRLARIRQARAIPFLCALFLLFLALSFLVHSPMLLEADRTITRWMQGPRSGWLDRAAAGLTFCGNTETLLLAGSIGAVLLLRTGHPRAGLLCAVTVLGVPLNYGIKHLVGRPRPTTGLVEVILPAVGLSFPSGHAMASVMVYGFLALMAWIHIPHRRWRGLATGTLAGLALGISLSRVYVGAHWLSDVFGGWVAGLFFLLILAEIYQAVGEPELAPGSPETGPVGSESVTA